MLEISVFALDHAVIAQRQLTASDTHRVFFDVCVSAQSATKSARASCATGAARSPGDPRARAATV
jgi:hypothetical protein